MLPPRLIRRLILAPLVVVIAVALIVLFPVLAVVTVVFALVGRLGRLSARGRMRSLRLLWFAVVWLAAETAALFVSLGLWIASGFGGRLRTEPFQNRNYATMRWFLAQVYRSAIYTFGLRIEIEGPPFTAEERLARLARPVIVLSRHAGPGDSILLVHHLLSMYDRRPRVVMKAALQLDPILDVMANRVPNVFIGRRDGGRHLYTEEIERLARGLDQDGALVIFPEGGNWTPGRWRRGIQRLERRGRRDLAAGRGRCRTCCRRSRAGCSPRSAPVPRRTSSSSRTPAWTGWSRWATCGGTCRSTRPCAPSGGASRSTRCHGRRAMRPRSNGCTTGGSGSTPGSPSTVRPTRRAPRSRRRPMKWAPQREGQTRRAVTAGRVGLGLGEEQGPGEVGSA